MASERVREMESDQPQPQQLTGVVIISLPPPDNPSLGKTITAFTLSDPDSPHQNHLPIQSPPPPPPQPSNQELQFSLNIRFFVKPKKILTLLGISVLALFLYGSVSSNTILELRSSNDDDREPKSTFLFPLYPKLGSKRDVELKLGRFVEVDRGGFLAQVDDGIGPLKINKLVDSKSVVDSSTLFPVRGNVYPDGLYFTYMLVGSPPKPYFLDLDTGSDLTWIQCDAPCASCATGAHPLYKPARGKIVPPKDSFCVEVQRNEENGYCETCHQCDYEIEYADHSSSLGVLARDELHLMMANGSVTKLNAVFGCAYDQQGVLLKTLAKTDGILGLSRAKISLPSQFASQGIINNVVGHCLTSDADGGGYMFLGDDFVPNWGMAWVPMLNTPSTNFYHTQIAKINYGSTQLSSGGRDSGAGRVVFDSGSSYTYFTKQAYSDLVASLKEVSDLGLIQDLSDPMLPICWRAELPIRSVTDVKHFFKTLNLQLGSKWWIISAKFRIPPDGYLIISNKGNVCLGILDGSRVHDGSTIILGDISLRGQLVIYDNVNHKIGWVRSGCAKPHKYKSLPFI